MIRFLPGAVLAVLVASPAAHADRASADRCAASLSPSGKALYEASLPEVLGGEVPANALSANARELVASRQLSPVAARSAAVAAAPCLRQATVGAGVPGVGVTPGYGAGAPGVGVTPGYGAGAPEVGVTPGVGVGAPGVGVGGDDNLGGPVNRAGRR